MLIWRLGAIIVFASGCHSVLGDKINPAYCAAHPTDEDCTSAPEPDAQLGCSSSAQCTQPKAVCMVEQSTCVQCTDAERGACTGDTPACGDDHTCVACTAADRGACTGPTPVCGSENTCVQCTAADVGACAGTTPVCGGDNTCRTCVSHAECASAACLPDGACGDDINVAYVSPAGTGTSCTHASPCLKVDEALKTRRPFVKFQGTTNEQVSLNDVNVTFLSEPGAKLTSTSNGFLLKIDGASQISIYDLELTGASGSNGTAILLQPTTTATVHISRVTISGNTGPGILLGSGTLDISRSTITGNVGAGITTSGGVLNLAQSTIAGNGGGGILINGSAFVIRNNFVYRNGNALNATTGGINIGGPSVEPSKLELNTIADNLSSGGGFSVGGVFCDRVGYTAAGNLIFRNTGGASGSVQTLGVCSFGNSFVSAGTSSVDNTPMFVHPNSAPFDYHLTAASPKTIVDAAGLCTGSDFDGDPRPIGTACDLGADEYKP